MKTSNDPPEAEAAEVDNRAAGQDAFNVSIVEHRRRLQENDDFIRGTVLDNGKEIVAARTRLFTSVIAKWAAEQKNVSGYSHRFAVGAIGGTGRGEVTPCSDLDIVFLFELPVEESSTHSFVLELQRQTLHTTAFRDRFGFSFCAMPYGLQDASGLQDKDLNAFLDLAPVFDPDGLVAAFRQRIRETFDPFEHFLHVRRLWLHQWERAGAMAERIDHFDIKNDGLRLFLAGVWTEAGKGFLHSHEVYEKLSASDPRDLDAYHFLLRLRCWIHLQRKPGGVATALGNHIEDVMTYHDFASPGGWLGETATDQQRLEFANEVRSRLLSARRRIAAFARGIIEGELRTGRRISPGHPVALGAGGLFHAEPETCVSNGDRSRAALSLLLMAQRYELPVDPSELQTTFRDAGDWLEPVPEMAALFLESRGSLAATFDFLSRIPGAEERLFPGYGLFESSFDERVRTERHVLRGPLEREKMRALEADRKEGQRLLAAAREPDKLTDVAYAIRVEVEAAMLTETQLASVKLALKTKRLPVTPDDLAARNDPRRTLEDRFSSGFSSIPLERYYGQCFQGAGFGDEVLELARFLVENRRTFLEFVTTGLIDERVVTELLSRCGGDLDRLRALYVFTHADHHAWKSPATNPTQFFNIRELYAKARMPADRRFDPAALLESGGYADAESLEILTDFGRDFFEGIYRHYAVRFGGYLLRLTREDINARPRVTTIVEGKVKILGVAARDSRGLAASIIGTLWKHGVGLQQAHLFSAMNHGLALDFFHLAPVPENKGTAEVLSGPDLNRLVETAIADRLHLSDLDEDALPDVARNVTLTEWRPGLYRLHAATSDDIGALAYLLCLKAGRRFDANIHGLAADSGRDGAWVSVYLNLPEKLALEDARAIAESWG